MLGNAQPAWHFSSQRPSSPRPTDSEARRPSCAGHRAVQRAPDCLTLVQAVEHVVEHDRQAGRSEPARGRLAMYSMTSSSIHRTARSPTRMGFGNRDSAIRS